jgi:glutamyl-tRNA synthetase
MPSDLAPGYDLGKVSQSTARFDPRHMLALNRKLLHGISFDAVKERLPEGADEDFWLAVRGNLDLLREAKPWFDVVRGTIVPPVLEGEEDFLRAALDVMPAEPWDTTTWSAWTSAIKVSTGRKGKALFLPMRLALTGEEHGPDIGTMLPLIGRDKAATRLKIAEGS